MDFWRSLAKNLTDVEMKAYTENGPLRGLLIQLINDRQVMELIYGKFSVEAGGMLKPFSEMLVKKSIISSGIVIDPIYNDIQPKIRSLNLYPSTLEESEPSVVKLIQEAGDSILVFENSLNYIDQTCVSRLLKLSEIKGAIVANNSGAHWGNQNEYNLITPDMIVNMMNVAGLQSKNTRNAFITENVIVDYFTK